MKTLASIAAWLVEKLLGWWWGKRKVAAAQEQAAADHAEVQQDRQIVRNEEARHEAEQAAAKLPEAPPVTVADAPAGSAAGELRDHWTRD